MEMPRFHAIVQLSVTCSTGMGNLIGYEVKCFKMCYYQREGEREKEREGKREREGERGRERERERERGRER